MVHPDYQYDPRLVPEMIGPIERDEADVVFGSRMMGVSAYKQGMPWWKYLANRFLTGAENRAFGLHLSEFHTGYRAYRREVLESVNFRANSDNFIFDQEIVAQIVEGGWRMAEIPVPVRYFPEASSANFVASTRYGFSILWLLVRYRLHRAGFRSQQFVSFRERYRRVS
jgi:glycosyltransferase involved in cell wall biosynthesis